MQYIIFAPAYIILCTMLHIATFFLYKFFLVMQCILYTYRVLYERVCTHRTLPSPQQTQGYKNAIGQFAMFAHD